MRVKLKDVSGFVILGLFLLAGIYAQVQEMYLNTDQQTEVAEEVMIDQFDKLETESVEVMSFIENDSKAMISMEEDVSYCTMYD